jgi:hypothetical protein
MMDKRSRIGEAPPDSIPLLGGELVNTGIGSASA